MSRIRSRIIAVALAAATAVTANAAVAQDAAATTHTIDLQNLIFFKDKAYSVTYEDSISREATSHVVLRKIAYGHTSFVNIMTTPSGIYSSEGMTSPHILYPGIHVEQVPLAVGDAGAATAAPPFAYWTDAAGWVAVPTVSAGSFVIMARTPGGTIIRGNDGNCVITATAAFC